MNKLLGPLRLALLFTILTLAAFASAAPWEQGSAATITPAGRSVAGKQLFDLKADKADVLDLLKQLFAKAGVRNYEISPEIRQNITLSASAATADELIEKVRSATVPPVNILTNGTTVFVTRSASAVSKAEEIRRRMEANQNSRLAPSIVPSGLSEAFANGYRDTAALETLVSLNVPDDRPITLGMALQLLERQSRVPLRLDPGVPADIKFTGVVTRVPLRSVLQNLAPGTGDGSLKVVSMPTQILIAPSDRFNLYWNGGAVSSTLSCAKCRQPVLSVWSYCPNCGLATRRGQLQGGQIAPGGGRRSNPSRPD